MTEQQVKWTAEQLRAVKARGRDVIVSASAGTGKTSVLSGRCVEIVAEKELCRDIQDIVVLTFTDAAAEQMRRRIGQQLAAAYQRMGDVHIRRQLMLLQGAQVSTIHSFCRRLVEEYFYRVDVEPGFRVIDEDEAGLLKAEILEKTVDWAWEQSHLQPALVELFRGRNVRGGEGFLANIISVSDFLETVVGRAGWYERALTLAGVAEPERTELGRIQKEIVAERLRHILRRIRFAQELCGREKAGQDWCDTWQQQLAEPVEKCLGQLKAGDWQACAEGILNLELPPRVQKPRGLPELLAQVVQKAAKDAKAQFESLRELAVVNPDYVERVGVFSSRQTRVMIELVKKFEQLYGQAKRRFNCLDFADLERYALGLLAKQDGQGQQLEPSTAALAVRKRYRYLFVDEYQDVNPVQQAILEMVGCSGRVFRVGDVKQSIYAWRGAEPHIFVKQLKQAEAEPRRDDAGLRVDLKTNFRSRRGILDFVNAVFARLMTESSCGIAYDESAWLRPADLDQDDAAGDTKGDCCVELHLLATEGKGGRSACGGDDEEAQGDSGVLSGRQLQAALIAQRIKELVEGKGAASQVWDKQEQRFRQVRYGDIVVLMRSVARKADFVEVLRLAGIPVTCDAIAGYFEATEISDMLCLLKVLDNPLRDIEFAAVLRSPLFGISDTELAKIRLHTLEQQDLCFYERVMRYRASGAEKKLAEKLGEALGLIESWRTMARRGELAELIWRIYRQRRYLSFVCGLPNGRARKANLLKLHDRAIQFEGFASGSGIASLGRFVEFIEKLQEKQWDWAPAQPSPSAENSVRVETIHKSKGLEFPVVFLADLNSRFNRTDISGPCLTSGQRTLGLQVVDSSTGTKLSSLAHQVIAEEKEKSILAEELRILYVATTRARDRLILTAHQEYKRVRQMLCEGFLAGGETVAYWQLRRCRNPLEWLVYALCRQRRLHEAFETGLEQGCEDGELFELRVYGEDEMGELSRKVEAARKDRATTGSRPVRKSSGPVDGGQIVEKLKASLRWEYPGSAETVIPAKQSVSELTHSGDEYARFDLGHRPVMRPVVPAGRVQVGASGRQRQLGSAFHLVMAELDIAGPVTEATVELAKARLVERGALSGDVAQEICSEAIVKFFGSEPGRKMLEEGAVVLREWPFTYALPVERWCEIERREVSRRSQQKIVVQGVVDVVVAGPEGLVVIDFKTDQVDQQSAAGRAELYRGQVELYAEAASAILERPIAGKWLYFFAPGRAVAV